jgi:hypothetical protein
MGEAKLMFSAGICNLLRADLAHIFVIGTVADHSGKTIARRLGDVSYADLRRGRESGGNRAEWAHDFFL